MLLTFIALDLNAVRREATLRFEESCGAEAVQACRAPAVSAIQTVKTVLIANNQ